jgi:hypothetical protein
MTETKQNDRSLDNSPGEIPLLVTVVLVLISLVSGGCTSLKYGKETALMVMAVGTTISIIFGPILGLWVLEWLDNETSESNNAV